MNKRLLVGYKNLSGRNTSEFRELPSESPAKMTWQGGILAVICPQTPLG
jgi:hypothetical protein